MLNDHVYSVERKFDKRLAWYGNAGLTEKAFITQHTNQSIPETSWVCKKHLIEAK